MLERLASFLGFVVFLGVLYLYSENKKMINWRVIATGLLLQVILGLIILGIPALQVPGLGGSFFSLVNSGFIKVLEFSETGSTFLFGPLVQEAPFAFSVLPTIVFFSSLMAVFYHLKILPYTVYGFSWFFSKLIKISGAEALAASANIFVGQTEAPLIVKPFLKSMTRSEIFCLMVGGMATVAGGVMAAYVGLLKDSLPSIGGHLLTASILSAPAAFVCSKILVPETETPLTQGGVPKEFLKSGYSNFIDACAKGTLDGLKLAVNVGAMLIAFISLVAFFDYLAGEFSVVLGFHEWGEVLVHPSLYSDGQAKLTFSVLFSWIFYPFSLLLGVSINDSFYAASLLSKKLILNEFIAYVDLSKNIDELSDRSAIILSYALCGFANFSSIGIQIGGIGALEESKKTLLSQLGIKSLLGGTIAAYLTGCFVGIII